MREAMLRVVFFWLVLFMTMQPILSSIDYFLDLHVRSITAYIAEKAAPEGMVTSQLRDEAIELLTAVGFRESDIEITYTNTMQDRGNRIDVIVKVPRDMFFLYNFASNTPSFYYSRSSVMSEYID